MKAYNPEQPLLDMLEEVRTVQAELTAAEDEYTELQAEIEKQFGERREAINIRRTEARAQADAIKDRFSREALNVWGTVHAPQNVRKFFTVDNLITVAATDALEWDVHLAEAKRIEDTNTEKADIIRSEVARAKAEFETWVRQMHPGWLIPDWKLIKKEALAGITPMPLKVVTDNQVRVNMDKVAALGEIDAAAIVEKATEKASTKLMVQEQANAD